MENPIGLIQSIEFAEDLGFGIIHINYLTTATKPRHNLIKLLGAYLGA